MSDKERVRGIVQAILDPAQALRTPWTPVSEEQAQRRRAEVAEMLRYDTERLDGSRPTNLQQAGRGNTPPNATRP